jgi:hypothetical protein
MGLIRTLAILLCLALPAGAAELDGVKLPDSWTVGDKTLRLNGIGARVYSLFKVRIYVAGLYLDQPSKDAGAILASPAPKVVHLQMLHPVSRDDSVKVWRDAFAESCRPPCAVEPAALDRFLGLVRDVDKNTTLTYVFTDKGLQLGYDGKVAGDVESPTLARLVLATFIGDRPPTPELKRGLLGG